MSSSAMEVTSRSEQPRGIVRAVREHYAKDQERKGANELDSRLKRIYRSITDAVSKLQSKRLGQAISEHYSPENAQRAVLALIEECELSLREHQRLESLVGEYVKQIKDLEIERNNNVRRLEIEKGQLIVNYEKQMAQVHSERQNERARLLSDHADQQVRLKRDIEALNGVLLKRDDFKPLRDIDLSSLFSDLAIDIDHVARMSWKYDQTDWTNEILGQLAKNPRRLKKNMLQESLWSVLYDNIFYSPFRVLGEEGRSLETEWNVAFGQDHQPEKGLYSWPKASLGSERWRYVTIQKCQEVLAQPTSEWDPLYKLKKGFESSLDTINKKLSETIGKVSDMDNETVQALKDITRKAAKIWLEFNTQRCRILVHMLHSSLKPPLLLGKIRGETLELMLEPPLRRFGDSKGQDFDKQEMIAGCEGVYMSISNP